MSWSCSRRSIEKTILYVIVGFIVMVLPFLIYNAVVKPRDPIFAVDNVSVTGFNLTSDGHFTSFFDVLIRANNPNNHKLTFTYRDIRVSIFKDKQKLAEYRVPGYLFQPTRSDEFVRAKPVAFNVTLKKDPHVDFVFESGYGYLKVDVYMTAWLYNTPSDSIVQVNCRNALVNLTAPALPANIQTLSFNITNVPNFKSIGCSLYIN